MFFGERAQIRTREITNLWKVVLSRTSARRSLHDAGASPSLCCGRSGCWSAADIMEDDKAALFVG